MGASPGNLPIATAGFFYPAETTPAGTKRNLSSYRCRDDAYKRPAATRGAAFRQGAHPKDVMNVGSPQEIIEKLLYQHGKIRSSEVYRTDGLQRDI